MSNPTELLPSTSIAATSWWEFDPDVVQLRVYTQDIQGNIRESRYSTGAGWSGGTSDDILVKARPNSPLAAISWASDNMGTFVSYNIRLYYISPDNIVRELCTDTVSKTWSAGGLDGSNIEASPVSRLEAVNSASQNGRDISLFYQRPDGALGNIYYCAPINFPTDKKFPTGWFDYGVVGRKPLFGTGLAAVPFYTGNWDTTHNKLFYQLPTGQLAEADVDWQGKWSEGDIPAINDAAAATNISGWGGDYIPPGSEPTSFRLCYLDKRNNPIELLSSNNQWGAPKRAGKFIPIPASDISTIQVKNGDNLRLYVQDDNNVLQEYTWAKGQAEWSKGSLIPTGNLQ